MRFGYSLRHAIELIDMHAFTDSQTIRRNSLLLSDLPRLVCCLGTPANGAHPVRHKLTATCTSIICLIMHPLSIQPSLHGMVQQCRPMTVVLCLPGDVQALVLPSGGTCQILQVSLGDLHSIA